MKTLVIFTHPNHKSLNGAFLNKTLDGLEANNDEVKVIDLYKENFNPVLYFDENKKRRDMHKDPELKNYREAILWSERIVLIYPIFWGRPPAMLLGFVDRMFASGFAYQEVGKLMPEGLLKGREVVVISTMKGPTNYIRLFINNAHQALMKKALFSFVGIKKVKFFEFGDMESKKNKQEKALEKIQNYFSKGAVISNRVKKAS